MADLEFDPAHYRPRIMDSVLEEHLQAFGAVMLAGTMWSGKTWTTLAHSGSSVAVGLA